MWRLSVIFYEACKLNLRELHEIVRLGEILAPRIGAEVGGQYAKSRASVNERKHIKRRRLIKGGKKKQQRAARE